MFNDNSFREAIILSQLKSPLIPECYYYWIEYETESTNANSIKDSSLCESSYQKMLFFIAMEYFEGDSLDQILENKRKGQDLQDQQKITIIRNILQALKYIHSLRIMHRDLKPANILVSKDFEQLKLIDFGSAKQLENNQKAKKQPSQNSQSDKVEEMKNVKFTLNIGTEVYQAPECKFKSNIQYNEQVDMYSLGIIILELHYQFTTNQERQNKLNELKKLLTFKQRVKQVEEFKDLDEFSILKDPINNFQNQLKQEQQEKQYNDQFITQIVLNLIQDELQQRYTSSQLFKIFEDIKQ